MKTDRSKPLAPLSPASTQPLGEPETIVVAAGGNLDHRIRAWKIGTGKISTGGPTSKREIEVRIWLLPTGVLLTNVTTRQFGPDGSALDTGHGQYHETPQGALDWLIKDGKGKLGPASKAAWLKACDGTFPPMTDMHIDDLT